MQADYNHFKEKQKWECTSAPVLPDGSTGNLHHDYFRRIPFGYLRRLLEKNDINLDGTKLHVASCGSGIDAAYLLKFSNPEIYVSDLSQEALKSTLGLFPQFQGQTEDNEQLSFPDDFFDFSFVAASLHHLPRPVLGLYELLRVSKRGVIVIEPNDSCLTRLAGKIGLAQEYEVHGNYVYRFSRRDVKKIASSLLCDFKITQCFAVHRIAKSRMEFFFLKIINKTLNTFCPSLGNYIIFAILKPSPKQP
jgi:ubiquinone/menaquinone biosynthesis C-methylase UbiE